MSDRRLLPTIEVCRKLAVSRDWFSRHRKALEAEGFPPPVPHFGLRWDSAAIDRWLDQQGRAAAPVLSIVPEDDAALHARLAARAAALAASSRS